MALRPRHRGTGRRARRLARAPGVHGGCRNHRRGGLRCGGPRIGGDRDDFERVDHHPLERRPVAVHHARPDSETAAADRHRGLGPRRDDAARRPPDLHRGPVGRGGPPRVGAAPRGAPYVERIYYRDADIATLVVFVDREKGHAHEQAAAAPRNRVASARDHRHRWRVAQRECVSEWPRDAYGGHAAHSPAEPADQPISGGGRRGQEEQPSGPSAASREAVLLTPTDVRSQSLPYLTPGPPSELFATAHGFRDQARLSRKSVTTPLAKSAKRHGRSKGPRAVVEGDHSRRNAPADRPPDLGDSLRRK